MLDRRLGVVREDDHRVVLEERVDPAARVHHPLDRAVGLDDRARLRVRPVPVRVRVVVGQRQQHEVEQVVLDHVRGDAPRMAVALARHAERRAAVRLPRREQVRVEELGRPPHGVPELRRLRDPRVRAGLVRLVPVPAAEDQVGRARGAEPGVLDDLEHGPLRAAQVREVHVVDRVVERAHDPERARGGERRAVLDVALLAAVVPVHRRDEVAVRTQAGRDARRRHRRDRREARHAVADVDAAFDERLQRRRSARVDRALEHLRLERVDDR